MSEEQYHSIFTPQGQETLAHQPKGSLGQRLKTTLDNVTTARTIISLEMNSNKTGNAVEADKDKMSIFLGDFARSLGDKSEFPGLMTELGYKAPDSITISTDIPAEQRLATATKYYEQKGINRVFCKPLNGARQRDLRAYDIIDPHFGKDISEVTEDTLVQEFMPHEGVMRYTRYKAKSGESFVSCYTYKNDRQPRHISGIGDKKIPGTEATVDKIYRDLRHKTSIPLPNDQSQLGNVNMFMDEVISRLEEKLGGKLPFFSCDIGIKEMEKLQGEYDKAKLNENLVFFETQALPGPPRGEKHQVNGKSLKAYLNLGSLFLREHSSEIVQRAREVRKRIKTA